MKTVVLFVLITLCAVSAACAQDTITINSGSVFVLGNDLGNPPFALLNTNDTLRVLCGQCGTGIPLYPGLTWQHDAVPHAPAYQQRLFLLDTQATDYADSLRKVPTMTQDRLTRAVLAFYQQNPDVYDARITDIATGSIDVRGKDDAGKANYAIGYSFPLVARPAHAVQPLDTSQHRDYLCTQFANALRSGGVVIIGNQGKATWSTDPALAQTIRSAKTMGPFATRQSLRLIPQLHSWPAEVLARPCPLYPR